MPDIPLGIELHCQSRDKHSTVRADAIVRQSHRKLSIGERAAEDIYAPVHSQAVRTSAQGCAPANQERLGDLAACRL